MANAKVHHAANMSCLFGKNFPLKAQASRQRVQGRAKLLNRVQLYAASVTAAVDVLCTDAVQQRGGGVLSSCLLLGDLCGRCTYLL